MPATTSLVGRSLDGTATPVFEERVAAQADRLRTAIEAGELDNDDFAVGLEMEVYAVEGLPGAVGQGTGDAVGGSRTDNAGAKVRNDPANGTGDGIHGDRANGAGDGVRREQSTALGDPAAWAGRLARLPEAVFEAGATKELGEHNAEINTDPDVCSDEGLSSQAAAIEAGFEAAQRAARAHDRELVLDAMWTIPPAEGSASYLGAHHREDGFVVAENMRSDPRYHAIDNEVLGLAGGEIPLDVPGVETAFPSILFESLATSIQPHLQIPDAESVPAHFNAGIRTLGPLLALATNSPFLPADCYGDVGNPRSLVDETHHELRIAVFEQSVNVSPNPKVRVPGDIESPTDVVDRVVEDDLYAPFLREWIADGDREIFADEIWEFDYRRSTYWRWLRCVVGGDPVTGAGDERSLRIEYRPLPTQPTVADVVGLQALTVGLLRGLVAADHPLAELPWAAAEESFYSAAENGLDAELAWVTADGERTGDHDRIFAEVFEYARRGLAESCVDPAAVEEYLAPIEARVEAGRTPSAWKKERVREGLADGLELGEAIESMQRAYVRRSRETDSFAEWL